MKVVKEFREFAMRGNVIDLAVWVIIGTAFGKIVSSIVEDMIMPVIAKIIGNVDFSNLYFSFMNPAIPLGMPLAEAKKLWPVLAYGNFLTITLNFLIIAFCIFLVVKAMTKAMPKKKEPEAAPAGPTDIELLTEIRDLLKKGK
jgi:large conductance mechanosensitive channel